MSDNIQSQLNDVVARNWRASTISPDQAAARAQQQADAYTNEQLAMQQQPPPSWPAQQAFQRGQQQMAADAAARTDAALRARQQAANSRVSKKAAKGK